MEDTPTVCGSDLPTVLRILKMIQHRELCVCVCVFFVYQPKLRPGKGPGSESVGHIRKGDGLEGGGAGMLTSLQIPTTPL